MSDTCSLFPLFGDPWPSCLLPSQWFALAGPIDPSAPKGWWPDALATRTLELT